MKALVSIITVVVVLLAVLWEEKLFPYALLSLLAYCVTWGVDLPAARRKSWGTVALLGTPVVVVSLSMMFGKYSEPVITVLANTFDSYFSGFFFGLARTTEKLATAGYAERLIPIKGYAVLAFIVSTLCAWKFLCEVATIENMNTAKLAKFREGPVAGLYSVTLILLLVLLLPVMGMDVYSPRCTRRCSGIQRGDFPFFQFFTFWLSLAYVFVGFLVATSVGRIAAIPQGSSENKPKE